VGHGVLASRNVLEVAVSRYYSKDPMGWDGSHGAKCTLCGDFDEYVDDDCVCRKCRTCDGCGKKFQQRDLIYGCGEKNCVACYLEIEP